MSTLSRLPAQGSPNQDKTGRILTETLIALTSVSVLAPSAAPTLTGSTTGGTLAAATYYYVISAVNATGESAKSTEANVTTTGTTSSVGLTWPAVLNATSYKVYRGTSTGTEGVYYSVAAPASGTPSFTDIGGTTQTGTPLSANTTIANLVPTDYFHLVTLALASPTTLNFGIGSTISLPYAGQSYATPPNVGDEIQCLFTNASGSSQTVTLGTGSAVTATTLVIANNKTGNITLTFNGAIWCETARSVTV
jgi:type II secretory pathway pseudopilin PulG